jgi:hypothetical protein
MKSKKQMRKINVKLCLQGRGHNVKAYTLGPKELKRLLSATEADAIYEDNPYSLVGMLSTNAETVTLGLDPARCSSYSMTVEVDSKRVIIDGLVFDSGDADDLLSFNPESQLIVREDALLALGKDFRLKKNQVVVLETINLRDATLSTSFQVTSDFKVADVALVAANLDAPFELARASYDLGLLDGMDQDIRKVRHASVDHDLELEIINSSQSSFYLCRRSEDGEWSSEFLG